MINSTSHQSWLFYSPLARQAALLKDDLLDPVDQLLEDPALLDLVRQCLAARSPASVRTGRPTIAPDRLLRCCVMKHLKGWSFRDLERVYLFTGWRCFSEQVLKIPLDKFRDFGYVKLREFEHGVAEELPSSWPHRKIKAEDRLPSAAVAQYSRRE